MQHERSDQTERCGVMDEQVRESTEKKLLGVILQDNRNFKHASARLTGDDFYLGANKVIYRCMEAMFADGRGVDAVTLTSELAKHGHGDILPGYVSDLDKDLPRFYRDVPQWVDIIAKHSFAHKVRLENADFQLKLQSPDVDVRALLAEHKDRLAAIEQANAHAPTTPMFVDAMDFVSAADKTTDWLIHELIPRSGNGIIGGDPKASKSFAAVDIALSAACGASWMGHPVIKRAKVAIVSREDDAGLTRRRMKKLIGGRAEYADLLPGWLHINTRAQQSDFQVTTPEHMDRLIDELGKFGAELVILDVFRSLHHADENDNSEVAKVLAKVSRIQTELKCATLLVHHIAKSDNPNPFKGLRGASCIHGWLEYGMAVSVVNPELDRADYVRRVQFESKECAVSDVYYKIVESPDHSTVKLDQQAQWERPQASRGKVQQILERHRADLA
jgi:hypothetical protein